MRGAAAHIRSVGRTRRDCRLSVDAACASSSLAARFQFRREALEPLDLRGACQATSHARARQPHHIAAGFTLQLQVRSSPWPPSQDEDTYRPRFTSD